MDVMTDDLVVAGTYSVMRDGRIRIEHQALGMTFVNYYAVSDEGLILLRPNGEAEETLYSAEALAAIEQRREESENFQGELIAEFTGTSASRSERSSPVTVRLYEGGMWIQEEAEDHWLWFGELVEIEAWDHIDILSIRSTRSKSTAAIFNSRAAMSEAYDAINSAWSAWKDRYPRLAQLREAD